MKRRSLIIGYGLVVLGAFGVFQMKYQIESKERALHALQKQYLDDQKALRVLEAEWAFLNNPDQLQELVTKYSELGPLAPSRILTSPSKIPWRDPDAGRITPQPDRIKVPAVKTDQESGETLADLNLSKSAPETRRAAAGDDG